MNINQNEDIKYCNYCGSANRKSAVVCVECKKNIHIKYKPFYDFLKKHTRDDIKGTISDSAFSCIKKFLFSHLYGVSLSVMIVASSVSTIYATTPYIEKVTEVKTAYVYEPTETEEEAEIPPLNEDDLYDFYHLSGNYDAFVDELRASEPYWDTDASVYGSVSEMYAENNIDGFNYGGVHEMISNPIPMYTLDVDPAFADAAFTQICSDRYLDNKSALQGEQCTSSVAKILHSAGYRVAECNYVLCEAEGEYNFNTRAGGNVIKKLVYKFVFVEHEGDWYIVEDRLVDRVNV